MPVTDTIGDMLTSIRNALTAKADSVNVPSSKLKEKIVQIFKDEGFIGGFDVLSKNNKKAIHINLKYGPKKKSIISEIKRISTPGRHAYVKRGKIPKVRGGFGLIIVSTSKGIMTDQQARKNKVGGEMLLSIW